MKKIDIEKVKQLIKEKHGDLIIIDEATYFGVKKMARFIDKDYGEYFTAPRDVMMGSVCIKRAAIERASKTITPLSVLKQKIVDKHGDTVVIDEKTYIDTKHKATFIDKDYGKWETTPRSVMNGHGHPTRGVKKQENTCLNKYGTIHPIQNIDVQKKRKQTNLEKYGFENPTQNEEIREKINQTISSEEHLLKLPEIEEKRRQTMLRKYGCEYPTQNKEIREKQINTNIEKYGTACSLQNVGVRKKANQTNLKNLGVENPLESREIQEKIKQTNLKNLGVENPSQSQEIKDKKVKTCLEHFGVEHPSQCSSIQEKSRQTNLERYGVPYPMQDPEIALRCAKAQNNSSILIHWDSATELICTASYEVKVVTDWNENHVNFLWQHQTFTMPDGRTYRPDGYLIDRGIWVEIKGYFRDDAEEKWLWFHAEHPNSELWDEAKLKAMGIL